MKPILSILLMLVAAHVHAAGVWNGSTSDLSATVSSTAITYPVVMAAWIDLSDAPDADCVLALSDNGAGGSLDALQLNVESSGGTAKAIATAAGSASTASKTGLAASGRQFVAAVFTSNSSRKVWVGGSYGSAETTSRAVGNFTRVAIGSLHNGGVTASFDGPIMSAAIWNGIDADHVDLAVAQMAAGLSPGEVWHALPTYYKPLQSGSTGGIGASMTATDVHFESTIRTAWENEDLTWSEFRRLLDQAGYIAGGLTAPAVKHEETIPPHIVQLAWPDSGATPGPLPPHRVVVLDENERIQLAADDHASWLGATSSSSNIVSRYQNVLTRGSIPFWVEIESGTFTPGTSIAYLDDDGKCSDTGTVELGIAVEESGGLLRIIQTQ